MEKGTLLFRSLVTQINISCPHCNTEHEIILDNEVEIRPVESFICSEYMYGCGEQYEIEFPKLDTEPTK